MARKYKRCLGCGADVSPLAQRCDQCGSALSAVPLEMGDYVCEKCEAPLPGGSRFCPACGFAFEQAVPVPEGVPLTTGFRPAAPLPPPVAVPAPPPPPDPVIQPALNVALAQPLTQKQTPIGLVIGGLIALFVLGFGLSRMMPPPATSDAPVSAPSVAGIPVPLPAPTEPAPATMPSSDTSSNDASVEETPPEKSTPDVTPPAHTKRPAKLDTDDADTLSAYAPPGSGLDDVPLDISTLRDTVITPDDLKHKSLRALSLSHNSLFALHGYIFERPSMKSYFEAQPWYHPDASFSMTDLSVTERQNAQTIRAAERSQYGYGRATFDAQGQPYEQKSTNGRDPLTETAASGSGQNDQMMDLDTLQHRRVTPADLSSKSLAALSLSYNAIYAAHGYVFQRPSLRHAFESTRWYRPNPAFQESDLDSTERANLKIIRAYERTRYGY